MAQQFVVNVYGLVNNTDLAKSRSFSPTQVSCKSANANTTSGSQGSVSIYGILTHYPSGTAIGNKQYLIVETPTQLAALANA